MSFVRGTYIYLLQSVVIISILVVGLDIEGGNFSIPFSFRGDSMHHLMVAKGILDEGWWWYNSYLSAPFDLPMVAFPVNGNLDYLFFKIISMITNDPVVIVNVFWIFVITLSAAIFMFVLRCLNVEYSIAFVIGILFALLPHVFYRNVSHLMLVNYLIPGITLIALDMAAGRLWKVSRRRLFFYLIICLGVGFSYVYSAFFACVVLASACLIYVLNFGFKRVLILISPIVLIVVAAALNLLPSYIEWIKDPGIEYSLSGKLISESEIFGLKIRHLLIPIEGHFISFFQEIAERSKQAHFPLETENKFATLGFVASIGFIFLLAFTLMHKMKAIAYNEYIRILSYLNIVMLLVCTMGGFGALFNLLVSPDIRAYNRGSVYIACFSFMVVAILLQQLYIKARNRKFLNIGFYASILFLLWFGVKDQSMFSTLVSERNHNITRVEEVRTFVEQIQTKLEQGALIYQLPYVPYPHTPFVHHMVSQDHIAPYIYSNLLHWSWPTLSYKSVLFNEFISAQSTVNIIAYLKQNGFNGIWLDNRAFKDRNSSQAYLSELLKNYSDLEVLQSEHGTYTFINFHDTEFGENLTLKEEIVSIDLAANYAAKTAFGDGWHHQENGFRWTSEKADLNFFMPSSLTDDLILDIEISQPLAGAQAEVDILFNGEFIDTITVNQREQKQIEIPNELLEYPVSTLSIVTPDAQQPNTQDQRILGVPVYKIFLREVTL